MPWSSFLSQVRWILISSSKLFNNTLLTFPSCFQVYSSLFQSSCLTYPSITFWTMLEELILNWSSSNESYLQIIEQASKRKRKEGSEIGRKQVKCRFLDSKPCEPVWKFASWGKLLLPVSIFTLFYSALPPLLLCLSFSVQPSNSQHPAKYNWANLFQLLRCDETNYYDCSKYFLSNLYFPCSPPLSSFKRYLIYFWQ